MLQLEEESAAILEWLARELSVDTFVNLMEQYRPANRVGGIDHRDPDVGFPEGGGLIHAGHVRDAACPHAAARRRRGTPARKHAGMHCRAECDAPAGLSPPCPTRILEPARHRAPLRKEPSCCSKCCCICAGAMRRSR